jgi:hypothetical protein
VIDRDATFGDSPGPSPELRDKLRLISAVVVILASALLFALNSPRLVICALSVGCIAVCVLLDFAMSALAPALLAPRIISLGYALQFFWLLLVAVFGLTFHAVNSSAPDILDYPVRAILPNLLIPISALLAVLVLAILYPANSSKLSVWRQSTTAPSGIAFYLTIAAVIQPLYWFSILQTSESFVYVAYFVRVANGALFFMSLLAGRYSRQLPVVRVIWLITMLLNLVIGMAVGARFPALLPVGLYGVGYLLATPAKTRVRVGLMLAICAVPLVALSGAVGVIRGQIGRGGIEILSTDRIMEVVDRVFYLFSAEDEEGKRALTLEGIGRLVSWPNLVVPMMTPDPVSYRGLSTLPDEILASSKISQLSDMNRQDMYDLGLGSTPARLYGFTVNTHTSVEFGVLADGWSRGGPAIALAFGFLISLLLSVIEYKIRSLRLLPESIRLVLFGVLLYPYIAVVTSTMLYVIRSAVLYVLFVAAIGVTIEKLRPRFDLFVHRRHLDEHRAAALLQSRIRQHRVETFDR